MLSHVVTSHVVAPSRVAFAYLSDPHKLGRWSLGCFDTQTGPVAGVFEGVSLIDGGRGSFRIDADAARGWIDFAVGDPAHLVPRIAARVVDGAVVGYPPDTCLVTLLAWRTADMDDARWTRLQALHEAEIWLIKGQIERDAQMVAPEAASG